MKLASFTVVMVFAVAGSGLVCGSECLAAEQLWERRAELDKHVVRASFEWHYNFEVSDAHVWMADGTVRNLDVRFDGDQLRRSAPAEWKKVDDSLRSYWAKIKRAAKEKKAGPEDIWLWLDADVEVSLPPPQKDKDVIVLGPDLFLTIMALHSARKDGANKLPEATPGERPPSSPSSPTGAPQR